MIALSLNSGSNGNCIYVETESAKLLIDAGISGVKAERRLARHGRDIRDVDAVLITHDHSDHIASAGIFQRKYGLTVWVTPTTLQAAQRKRDLGKLPSVRHFAAGERIQIKDSHVETLPTPHDGADGVAFVVGAEGKRLGILTDLGHPFPDLKELLGTLDAVFLESNYDPHMLETGPYPPHIRQRIKGRGGHLSNDECAHLLHPHLPTLKWACLAHLSEQNNTPELALETSRLRLGDALPLHIASRYGAGELLVV